MSNFSDFISSSSDDSTTAGSTPLNGLTIFSSDQPEFVVTESGEHYVKTGVTSDNFTDYPDQVIKGFSKTSTPEVGEGSNFGTIYGNRKYTFRKHGQYLSYLFNWNGTTGDLYTSSPNGSNNNGSVDYNWRWNSISTHNNTRTFGFRDNYVDYMTHTDSWGSVSKYNYYTGVSFTQGFYDHELAYDQDSQRVYAYTYSLDRMVVFNVSGTPYVEANYTFGRPTDNSFTSCTGMSYGDGALHFCGQNDVLGGNMISKVPITGGGDTSKTWGAGGTVTVGLKRYESTIGVSAHLVQWSHFDTTTGKDVYCGFHATQDGLKFFAEGLTWDSGTTRQYMTHGQSGSPTLYKRIK